MTNSANIYAVATLPAPQAQLLLTVALVCLITGLLLVEKRALLRLLDAFSLSGSSSPSAREASL